MARPIQHLPVLQNWDCHVCGTCCQEYQVEISETERKRIESQNWDVEQDLGGRAPFKRQGWFRKRWMLNHRADDSCVFLSEQGRCRIHEKFGFAAKPLPCRLFPFVLTPVNDYWAVGMRYACPSAAANKGRPVLEHDKDLIEFARLLAEREGLTPQPNGTLTKPPELKIGHRLDWSDLLRVQKAVLSIIRNSKVPLERRLRQCLSFSKEMRKTNLDGITENRLGDLLKIMQGVAETETPADPTSLPRPGWIARVLFRQAAAIFTRKDHGPNRGAASRGWLVRLGAAMRFARGTGQVPRMDKRIPETTFAQLEEPAGSISAAVDFVLERYYTMKIGALQFCGPSSFKLPFWEGLETLLITYPMMRWVMRMYHDRSREDALAQAMSIVDDHVGFNKVPRNRTPANEL